MDDLFLQLQTALAGEYSIERELGRGGMGVVYLAREVRLAREVAIKVLPPDLARDAGLRAQFLREAQTAARLSHPNIVPIHRVDETRGFVYFVMAYVNGETLAQRVRNRGPLPPHHAARILREVAWALTYAHSNGIVHRDIKAENILLEQGTERALVSDFGIAGILHDDARGTDGLIAGSAHYASPEQIAGQPMEAGSDLYSLGIVGFLALTGRLPFDAPTTREVIAMQLNARPPAVTALAPTVPAKLSQIIERCLAKRVEHRYSSAAAFAEAVEQAVEPPREIPPPIRVWLNQTNRIGRGAIVLGLYASMGIGTALFAGTANIALAVLGGVTTLVTVIGGPFLVRARRLAAAGYGIDDVRGALREYWLRRREEAVYELASPTQGLGQRATTVVFGVSTAAAIALGLMATQSSRAFAAGAAIAGAFAVGSGMLTLVDSFRLRRIHRMGRGQTKFYNSKWAERFFRLAGSGLKNRPASSGLPQLTEVALGRATDALYDALPKDLRKHLKALPATVRRLEDDAKSLRAELEKLDASIAELEGDARAEIPSAIANSAHEAPIRADRDRLRIDLRQLRERAADRLAATVAALENIRLDLLRLQLGDGHVDSVTASLDAARNVASDLGAYVDATRELEKTLAEPRGR